MATIIKNTAQLSKIPRHMLFTSYSASHSASHSVNHSTRGVMQYEEFCGDIQQQQWHNRSTLHSLTPIHSVIHSVSHSARALSWARGGTTAAGKCGEHYEDSQQQQWHDRPALHDLTPALYSVRGGTTAVGKCGEHCGDSQQ